MPTPDVVEDLIAGDRYKLTLDGPTATRVFRVSGLPTSGMLVAACNAIVANGVYIGAAYPADPYATCSDITPEPFGKNFTTCARVTASYTSAQINSGNSEIPVVRFQASTRGVTTNLDRTGKVLRVSPPQALGALGAVSQIGQVSDDKAFGLLTAEWTVKTSPKWMLKYINTVNASAWFNEPKWTWWIRDIQIQPQTSSSWKVSLAAELDEELYTKVIPWRDPITGFIPTSIPQTIDKTTLAVVQGYTVTLLKGEMDFGKLPINQNSL